jgi:hypothetical protein
MDPEQAANRIDTAVGQALFCEMMSSVHTFLENPKYRPFDGIANWRVGGSLSPTDEVLTEARSGEPTVAARGP